MRIDTFGGRRARWFGTSTGRTGHRPSPLPRTAHAAAHAACAVFVLTFIALLVRAVELPKGPTKCRREQRRRWAWQRTIKCSLHGATRPSVATRPSSTITTDMHVAIDTSMPDRSAADLFILLKTLSAPSCRHLPWHVRDVSVGTMQNEPVDTRYVSPSRTLFSGMQRNELRDQR